MACSLHIDSPFAQKMTMEYASNLLVNTLAKNMFGVMKNSKGNILSRFVTGIKYMASMGNATLFYFYCKRPMIDFLGKVFYLAQKEFDKETSWTIYRLLKINMEKLVRREKELPTGFAFLNSSSTEYCKNCCVYFFGDLKQKNGLLDYENKKEEHMWINYLGQELKFAKEACSCSFGESDSLNEMNFFKNESL